MHTLSNYVCNYFFKPADCVFWYYKRECFILLTLRTRTFAQSESTIQAFNSLWQRLLRLNQRFKRLRFLGDLQGLAQGSSELIAVEARGGIDITKIATNTPGHIGADGGLVTAHDALLRGDRGIVLSDLGVVRHTLLRSAFELGTGAERAGGYDRKDANDRQ